MRWRRIKRWRVDEDSWAKEDVFVIFLESLHCGRYGVWRVLRFFFGRRVASEKPSRLSQFITGILVVVFVTGASVVI